MEFDTILNLAETVFSMAPFAYAGQVLSVIGGVALVATKFSKPKSQYKNKADKIFQTVLTLLGANFGKAANKD